MSRSVSGLMRLSLSMSAAVLRSAYEELVQEPTADWSTLSPARLLMVATRSGMCGCAARGTSLERSMTISSSYVAEGSALRGA